MHCVLEGSLTAHCPLWSFPLLNLFTSALVRHGKIGKLLFLDVSQRRCHGGLDLRRWREMSPPELNPGLERSQK